MQQLKHKNFTHTKPLKLLHKFILQYSRHEEWTVFFLRVNEHSYLHSYLSTSGVGPAGVEVGSCCGHIINYIRINSSAHFKEV